MGKRLPLLEDGAKIHNDDYDEENETVGERMCPNFSYDEEAYGATPVEFGLNSSTVERAKEESLEIILKDAIKAAEAAKQEASMAEGTHARLQFEAAEAEKLAAQLTQEAGITPAEVKAIAADIQRNGIDHSSQSVEELESSTSGVGDEGLEVQDFLRDEMKGSRKQYSSVIGEAIQASEVATSSLQALQVADIALSEAESRLFRTKQREKDLAEQSRQAAVTARCDQEHAESAKRRVCTVRDLLRKCEESANSARTVVVTATTESKISERRASEAETRASRALASAERDRSRAEEETKKEERLEEQTAELHDDLSEASNIGQMARDRVKKASAMLEKLNEQIQHIVSSYDFLKECQQYPNYRDGGPSILSELSRFPSLGKHASKLKERELCKDLIDEATSEYTRADTLRRSVHEKLEEKGQLWKIQANIAAQVRRQAERSAAVAEELAENAEEERNAASLRHIACKKAESNVQQRLSHLESVKAQLAGAERNAVAAASLAEDSRKRADHLSKELEAARNFRPAIQAVQDCRVERDLASVHYESARVVKEEKDRVAADTKRLLETNAELYSCAVRDVAAANHRTHSDKVCIQRAVAAYERALLARTHAEHAGALSNISISASREKCMETEKALEYRKRNSRMSYLPLALAKITWLHTTAQNCLEMSLNLPLFHVLSMSQQAFVAYNRRDARILQQTMRKFTCSHLCRIFPSTDIPGSKVAFESMKAWSMGCQLVSLDHFPTGEHLLLAEGRFRQNGSCGYVLKPSSLVCSSQGPEKKECWRIKVLRGNYLPKACSSSSRHCLSPYVKISLLGGEQESNVFCTKTVVDNGFNPVWDDSEGFDVFVARPSVYMLSLVVRDRGAEERGEDSFVAGAAIAVAHLRQGYRSVALFDASHTRVGILAYASLLVHCQKIL